MLVSAGYVESILAESAFLADFGFRLERLAVDECALRYPHLERHNRPGGVISGIVLMAAADVAMWFAIMTRHGRAAGDRAVTVDLKTNFLRGAIGDVITAARYVGETEQTIYGVAEARDPAGTLVAHHTLSYVNPK